MDFEGKYLFTNRAFQQLVGYTDEELRGMSFKDFTPLNDVERNCLLFGSLVAGTRRKFQIEKRYCPKTGELVWVRETVSLLSPRGGTLSFVVAIVEDITESKRAEGALHHSEERFTKVFRSSPVAIGISTVDGRRLIEVNDRYLEFFGYTREELTGRSLSELGFWLRPEDRHDAVRTARERGSARNFEAKFRTKSGGVRDALASMEALHLSGEVLLILPLYFGYALLQIIPTTVGYVNWFSLRLRRRPVFRDVRRCQLWRLRR